MRTNIEIDDELMSAAMKATGGKTKRETVEIALRAAVQQEAAHRGIMELYGTVEWEGDLDEMRRERPHARGDR